MKSKIKQLINHYKMNIDSISTQIKQIEIRKRNTKDIGVIELFSDCIKENKRDKQLYTKIIVELEKIIE